MPAPSQKRPASSPLNAEARQPTISIGGISPARARPSSPASNEIMLYSIMWHRKGGHNHKRKCRISRLYKPPLHFVVSLTKCCKRRGIFAGHYSITISLKVGELWPSVASQHLKWWLFCVYHSLTKSFHGHSTLKICKGDSLLSVSAFNYERVPMSCFQ